VLLVGEQFYEPVHGTLDILEFDDSGVRGRFHLEGKASGVEGEPLRIRGSFEIPCGDVAQSLCRR
jgi:hypothetical protein